MKFRLFSLGYLYQNEENGDGGNPGGGAGDTQDPPAATPPATGTADTDWRSSLGEEFKADPAFKDFKDLPSLAKNYKDLQSHLGNSIRIPSQEADEAQWAEFRNKLHGKVPGLISKPSDNDEEGMKAYRKALGVPDEASAYTYKPSEGDGIDEARLDQLRSLAHKHGLTPSQFEGILNEISAADASEVAEQLNMVKESQAKLYKEWGLAYEDRVGEIGQFLERSNAPTQLQEMIKANGVGGETLKWLHNLVKAVGGEGGNIEMQGKTTSQGGKLDPTEAMARADELWKQLMAMPQSDPRYSALVMKRLEYIKMANPGSSTSIDDLRADVRVGGD